MSALGSALRPHAAFTPGAPELSMPTRNPEPAPPDPFNPGQSDSDIDPMIYARVVRAMAGADIGHDLNSEEALSCLAESLNREFLLTRSRIDVQSLEGKHSALDIAGMILRMID